MTALVNKNPFGIWTWEITDDDGQLYLRSEKSFVDHASATLDLEAATTLIRPYVEYP